MRTRTLALVDASSFVEKILSGQVGFILATVLAALFFCKVMLPRFDSLVEAVRRLANAVKLMAVTVKLRHENASSEEIAEVLDGIDESKESKQ